MGFLSRLSPWRKRYKALPMGNEDVENDKIDNEEITTTNLSGGGAGGNKHDEFVKTISNNIELRKDENNISKDTNNLKTITYDPKGFKKAINYKDWYMTADLRNEYYGYSKNKSMSEPRPTYNGAIVIKKYASENDERTIYCRCIDSATRETQEIELGKIKGSYEVAMQEIDSIISLQMKKTNKDESFVNDIQRHYEKLEKMKGLELSVLGEEILSYVGNEKIILENVPYEQLYEKRVNFNALELKESLIQLPYICMQADIEGKSPESIDKIVEAFIDYSKLAIDIGCVDKWKEIDQMNTELRQYGFNRYNEPNDVKYDRKPKYKEESYKKIKDKFLNKHQAEVIDKIEDKETQNGFISQKDIQENFIHRVTGTNMAKLEFIVKTDVEDLSVKLGTYIEKYKEMHGKDSKYDEKINLLNDMVIYSQVVILESVRDRNAKQNSQENIEQELE